ncbi:SDR family NAD(P)-dependent oxidoreductase [Rhodococcus sp. T2V]|uniref:SDR family NAD(P)-dependent oxidoreductase n=1 Tax=Rhodococcus sp. T2V TaxID=3034164 RepID=UPI0023E2F8E3|nr:SDR family NAD(P)-dependent oxidoreductase [Rhodococcus sp. T2V]MDF3309683.1 SDR family NAD(P)-dependent oxidoreductase [Rhodococcus sp. T2V]
MVEELQDRVAVVTGAGSGIGRSIALALAGEGVDIVVADVDGDAAIAVADQLRAVGIQSISLQVDVADRTAVLELARVAYEHFGDVDILVNNAGVSLRPFRALWDTDYHDMVWLMGINFWGVVHGYDAFVPRMRESGGPKHIVNTASTAALRITPGAGAYTVSKSAVSAFSICSRSEFELAGEPIGVSLLIPGPVQTNIDQGERHRPASDRSENRVVKEWISYLQHGEPTGGGPLPGNPSGLRADPVDPDVVGQLVVDAIRENRPFVLTQPAPEMILRDRLDQIITSGRDVT